MRREGSSVNTQPLAAFRFLWERSDKDIKEKRI
ncbi:hypothetical protein EV664_102430 [Stakelama pacifica]|uniref:Uncharacterized protein n=1 Tax=Stakelama pacifica TaxID=517720 RepID=A0A4R6FWN0_9SPHN|nr:hypothetical protein EV664_102430 [Stakelama pacifica]